MSLIKTYRFYVTPEKQWFIDLPEWEGEKWELEMVSGADTLCTVLAQGEEEVQISFSETGFDGATVRLEYDFPHEGGAWYKLYTDHSSIPGYPVWLCHVTKFVFGDLPQEIFIK